MRNLAAGLEGKCFSQLLDNPDAGRMASDIEVEDAPPVMADDEEAVENAERDRRDGEEVHRCDRLAVIPQEGIIRSSTVAYPRFLDWVGKGVYNLASSFK